MYFVVLFLESFHSGVCKNNVGVLLVSVNSQSCRALHCYFCSFLWALDIEFLFTKISPSLSEGLMQMH